MSSTRGEVLISEHILTFECDSYRWLWAHLWSKGALIDQLWMDPRQKPPPQRHCLRGNVFLLVWSHWCQRCLWGRSWGGVHSGLVPLSLQTVTVTEVPPGFPLQTHFCFFRFFIFLSLLLSFSPNRPMSLSSACFLFLVGLFYQVSAKASYAPPSPSFLTHVWIISMKYFWVLFLFPHDCWIY